MKRLVGTTLLVCLAGCATPRIDRLASITVMERRTYAICAGYCPALDIVVRDDGQVTMSRRYNEHLQVSREQAAQFFHTLSSYRPGVREAGPATCKEWNTTEPLVVKVFPYQIVWTDADGSTHRLRSCFDPRLLETLREAFWSIGLGLGGEPHD